MKLPMGGRQGSGGLRRNRGRHSYWWSGYCRV